MIDKTAAYDEIVLTAPFWLAVVAACWSETPFPFALFAASYWFALWLGGESIFAKIFTRSDA